MNKILESYFRVADMIHETFGDTCEVAVHDLTHPKNSVVYVANGAVTGRTVGHSFDHLIMQVLLNKKFSNDMATNYVFTIGDKRIKSSSSLIRDENDSVIGMLCVNIDLTPYEKQFGMLSSFLPETPEKQAAAEQESPAEVKEITSIVDDLIDNIIGDTDVSSLKKQDNLEIIDFMDKKGIFLVKGAVDKIAERLNVSRVTIYNYLDEVRNKKSQEE